MTSTSKTRVGITGLGFMGMVHYLTYQKIPNVEVVAIADNHPERLAGDWTRIQGNFGPPGKQMDLTGITAYSSIEELIADEQVDLVDITLPPASHADIAIDALGAGKHVFCEKPMAMNFVDCDRMLVAANDANRHLLVGHVLPYFPEYAWALREIRSGKYGKLLGGSFKRMISDPAWLSNFWDADKVGGPMLDLHVHDAHFICLAFGTPTGVSTRGSLRNGLPERWHSLMEFSDPQVSVQATSGVINQQGRPFLHGFEIYLEDATLSFEFAVKGESASYTCKPTIFDKPGNTRTVELGDGDPMNAFLAELTQVIEVVNNKSDSDALAPELAKEAILLCQSQTESLIKNVAIES